MEEKKLTDISEVCSMLGCTSRALRFYEQKGIISSTNVKFKSRRQYNDEQIKEIKEVLVLRSLGLPIAKIKELKANNQTLADAIVERQSDLIATIAAKSKEYNLLCEALATINEGGNIFEKKEKESIKSDSQRIETVESLTRSFISECYDCCYNYFSDNLREYLPIATFKKVVANTLAPIGKFLEIEKIACDESSDNVYYSYLRYEKLGLYIKVVFHKEKIHGIWLNYYHYEGKK